MSLERFLYFVLLTFTTTGFSGISVSPTILLLIITDNLSCEKILVNEKMVMMISNIFLSFIFANLRNRDAEKLLTVALIKACDKTNGKLIVYFIEGFP